MVDYLETRDDVDIGRIAITGHSRGGKQALLAAALDERITLVVPNGSGAGGAGALRVLGPGAESIGMNDKPWWYHERIQMFGEHEAHLPFDQHYLKALLAPRGLYCIESTDDLFANPVGTYATSAAAMPAFELYDKRQRNAISFRRGGHTFSSEDWRRLLEFAELTFYDRQPASGRDFWQQPAQVTPAVGSGGKPGFVVVGDAGNVSDVDYPRVGSFGRVDHEFEIGRYKVSNAQYTEFLNAVAKETDTHHLYDPQMRIHRGGSEGGYEYAADPATCDAAVTYVSWYDAMRYCNWLQGGETESGAYSFSGSTMVGPRAASASYFLPTEDEWYKACYYDPETQEYRLHPLRDAHREHADQVPATRSSYGMMETADPTWEWTESKVGELFRGLRSDSWFQGNNRQAQGRFYINPELKLGNVGFRVAKSSGADLQTKLLRALDRNDYAAAEKILDLQVSQRPGDGDLQYRLAIVQAEQGKTEEALAQMRLLVKNHKHGEAARWIVQENFDKRKWSELPQDERSEFGSLTELMYDAFPNDLTVKNLYVNYLIASAELVRALPVLCDLSKDNPLRGPQAAEVARR